jgi:hypothetical protein
MATVRQRIRENDVVELRQPVEGWPTGTDGTVVAEQGDWKLVEIADESGVTLDFISTLDAQLKVLFKYSDDFDF